MHLQPHHIGLVVSDLARSTAFYEALGFRTARELPTDDPSRAIRFMEMGGFELELFWYADSEAAPAASPAGKGQLGFRHLAFRTLEMGATLEALKAAQLVASDATARVVPAGYTLLFLRDPDGIEIEIMQEA